MKFCKKKSCLGVIVMNTNIKLSSRYVDLQYIISLKRVHRLNATYPSLKILQQIQRYITYSNSLQLKVWKKHLVPRRHLMSGPRRNKIAGILSRHLNLLNHIQNVSNNLPMQHQCLWTFVVLNSTKFRRPQICIFTIIT